jgi:choline dehydrogenase-like flavoprotein
MLTNLTSDAPAFARKSYDIVIVGGGTAGLALASR